MQKKNTILSIQVNISRSEICTQKKYMPKKYDTFDISKHKWVGNMQRKKKYDTNIAFHK
jgi:hypothetical protein